ncbi:hypothetical protein ATKI12_5554 [Kitasatospora sp. Ki12]
MKLGGQLGAAGGREDEREMTRSLRGLRLSDRSPTVASWPKQRYDTRVSSDALRSHHPVIEVSSRQIQL